MQRFVRLFRNNKHHRRFAVVGLFLIGLELLCPIFSDETISTTAARQALAPTSLVKTISEDAAAEKSATVLDSQTQNNLPVNCTDECLCHSTPLSNAAMPPLREPLIRHELVAFNCDDPVTNSLPPPYHPPKFS